MRPLVVWLCCRLATGGAMDPVDQRVKPVEVELSRNLQTYLQRLGLLPKTSSASSLSPLGKVSRSAALCRPCRGLLLSSVLSFHSTQT